MTKGLTMRLIPALLMFGFAGTAAASGFALQNQGGSGNGNAFAGAAAAAEDGSTIFFNPAGMTYLPKGHSITASGTILDRSIRFRNTGTTNTAINGTNLSNGGQAGGTALLPHGYWSWSIADDVWVGVGVGPTFGNKTEYDKDFIGRNAGYMAEIEVININPSLAIKVNDGLSLGLGVNFAKAHVRFKQGFPGFVGTPVPGLGQPNNYLDVENDGDWSVGANIGAMFQLSPSTRVGVSYRSGMDFDIDGSMKMAQTPNTTGLNAIPSIGAAGQLRLQQLFRSQDVVADGFKLPGTLSLAVSQKLSDKWEMLGDVTWTDWSVFKTLSLQTKNPASATPARTQITSLSYNFEDTWRIGLGANYQYSDSWKFRFGVAHDKTPVSKNQDRTMTLPDADRTWLSFGGKYTLSKQASMDFGYSHIFFSDAKTSRAVSGLPGTIQTVNGSWNNNRADLLSVQYNHTF